MLIVILKSLEPLQFFQTIIGFSWPRPIKPHLKITWYISWDCPFKVKSKTSYRFWGESRKGATPAAITIDVLYWDLLVFLVLQCRVSCQPEYVWGRDILEREAGPPKSRRALLENDIYICMGLFFFQICKMHRHMWINECPAVSWIIFFSVSYMALLTYGGFLTV
jgi:hypothetical protein